MARDWTAEHYRDKLISEAGGAPQNESAPSSAEQVSDPMSYAPPLSFDEAIWLESHPYDGFGGGVDWKRLSASERKTLKSLVERGLLEQNPGQHVYRCTELGTEVVAMWKKAGWLE